jgi:hypothetical protein
VSTKNKNNNKKKTPEKPRKKLAGFHLRKQARHGGTCNPSYAGDVRRRNMVQDGPWQKNMRPYLKNDESKNG